MLDENIDDQFWWLFYQFLKLLGVQPTRDIKSIPQCNACPSIDSYAALVEHTIKETLSYII